MRALGFCVSREHAHYMARKFSEAGLQSVALTGDDAPAVRRKTLRDLQAGRMRCVFSVEVLGEGVDVPTSTVCCSCARPPPRPSLPSSSGAACVAPRARAT